MGSFGISQIEEMQVYEWQGKMGFIIIQDCKMHSTKRPVTTMLTHPWKCTVLHCNHLGNTWKPLVLMTWHFDYYPSASSGNNQSVRSSAPVVSRCFPGGYNVKLYISRGGLAWWLLAFLHSDGFTQLYVHVRISHIYSLDIHNTSPQGYWSRDIYYYQICLW